MSGFIFSTMSTIPLQDSSMSCCPFHLVSRVLINPESKARVLIGIWALLKSTDTVSIRSFRHIMADHVSVVSSHTAIGRSVVTDSTSSLSVDEG